MTAADDTLIRFAREHDLLRREASAASLEELLASGALDDAALAGVLARETGLPLFRLDEVPALAPAAPAVLPRTLALRHVVCELGSDGERLRLAVANPLDIEALDEIAHGCGRALAPGIAPISRIRARLARQFGRETAALAAARDDLSAWSGEAVSPNALADAPASVGGDDAPVIRLVQQILADAVRQRASDIHLEPLERRFRIRHRIDGVLVDAPAPSKGLQPAVISRLKIMANISIAEKRIPQDGRIQIAVGGRPLDLRVASLPTVHGESLVLRILDRQALKLGLSELGLQPDDEAALGGLLAAPDGIILVTGPTGSGKTTTLYGCLNHLNHADRKIITVEDPIEYQLPGVNQVPVQPAVGMTFAAALRAMLRQAPNIVMVGEIRDRETAEIAVNASLTGHLVFSTLHTNDAPGAVARLVDIGAKPFLLASALRAVVAQRLVRRVCPHCRIEQAPSERERLVLRLAPAASAGLRLVRGAGCLECNGTGYRGRVGLFEIFPLSEPLRALVHDRAGTARLRSLARREGMRTLREDGVRKVLAGLTTIEEVVAATAGDA